MEPGHVWFLGNSIVVTVFAVFVLRELALPSWAFGVALTAGGVGGFVGAMIAPRVGVRLGAGKASLLGRVLVVIPWLVLALAPLTADTGVAVVLVIVAVAQFVYCLAMGIEDTNDISYRQSVATDGIQGRMNSTIRTVNRVVFFSAADGPAHDAPRLPGHVRHRSPACSSLPPSSSCSPRSETRGTRTPQPDPLLGAATAKPLASRC